MFRVLCTLSRLHWLQQWKCLVFLLFPLPPVLSPYFCDPSFQLLSLVPYPASLASFRPIHQLWRAFDSGGYLSRSPAQAGCEIEARDFPAMHFMHLGHCVLHSADTVHSHQKSTSSEILFSSTELCRVCLVSIASAASTPASCPVFTRPAEVQRKQHHLVPVSPHKAVRFCTH